MQKIVIDTNIFISYLISESGFSIKIVSGIFLDKSDNKFLELAYTANADFIITGNKLHFTFADFYNTKIVSPKEYWENYKP